MIRCAAYFPALESRPGSLQDLRINPGISPKNVFHNSLKRAFNHFYQVGEIEERKLRPMRNESERSSSDLLST